jgi:hypothetical protein
MSSSQRIRRKNEATGMRVVSQTVQEFWECGWQPYEHRNDKGIDGLILMAKKGLDLGVKINVQVKCGVGYVSKSTRNTVEVSFDGSEGLANHIKYWRGQLEPVVLIFVNPVKTLFKKGGLRVVTENRLTARAYWTDLKNIQIKPGTKTVVQLDKGNVFGQHSKGDFLKLVGSLVTKKDLQIVNANSESLTLLASKDVKKDARTFVKHWKSSHSPAFDQTIEISRTGWRHINLSRRGRDRRNVSLKYLGLAKQIIEEVNSFVLLQQSENSLQVIQKMGLRAIVKIKHEGERNVQVVILRRISKKTRISKWIFLSVHNRG